MESVQEFSKSTVGVINNTCIFHIGATTRQWTEAEHQSDERKEKHEQGHDEEQQRGGGRQLQIDE